MDLTLLRAQGCLPHSAVMEASPPYTKGFQLRADIVIAVPSPLIHKNTASTMFYPGHKSKTFRRWNFSHRQFLLSHRESAMRRCHCQEPGRAALPSQSTAPVSTAILTVSAPASHAGLPRYVPREHDVLIANLFFGCYLSVTV